jgi:hypothetical protein
MRSCVLPSSDLLLHRQHLHVEDERGIRRDLGRVSGLAVGQFWRDA